MQVLVECFGLRRCQERQISLVTSNANVADSRLSTTESIPDFRIKYGCLLRPEAAPSFHFATLCSSESCLPVAALAPLIVNSVSVSWLGTVNAQFSNSGRETVEKMSEPPSDGLGGSKVSETQKKTWQEQDEEECQQSKRARLGEALACQLCGRKPSVPSLGLRSLLCAHQHSAFCCGSEEMKVEKGEMHTLLTS